MCVYLSHFLVSPFDPARLGRDAIDHDNASDNVRVQELFVVVVTTVRT